MQVDYFKDCKTDQERRARWLQLVKLHHPDVGGDVAVMQEVNRQYALKPSTRPNIQVFNGDMFWFSRGRAKHARGATEEVEPDVSYWKANDIDPYNADYTELMEKMSTFKKRKKEND